MPPQGPKDQIRVINLERGELEQQRKARHFRSNTVRTSKYTILTFIPFNLFEQFTKKLANLYFLIIMFMQMIKVISISNG